MNNDYLKFKIGDYVELYIKEKGSLNDNIYNQLINKKFHVINGIYYDERIENEEQRLKRPYISINIKNPMTGDMFKFPANRFKLFDIDQLDKDDPYGEEIYEIGDIFINKITEKEKKSIDYINDNIGKLWIENTELSKICRIISIQENYDQNLYEIQYVYYKDRGNINSIIGAEYFLNSFFVLTTITQNALLKQKRIFEKQFEDYVKNTKDSYKIKVDELESWLKDKILKGENLLKTKLDIIDEIIEISKKQ